MKRLSVKIYALATFLLFAGMAIGQNDDDRVLITIEDEEITVSEFMNIYRKNNVDTEIADKKSMKEYLDLYINFRLKVREARDLGMDTASAFVDELAGYRKQLAQPYFSDQEVTEELLREAYDRLMYDIRASHILIKVDENALPADTAAAFEKIMDARKRILAGEDFADVAAEVSDDPSARNRETKGRTLRGNGGDLGYFTVFDMVYPFETAAYETPVGEVSMPVRTAFGYHLIKVNDKQAAMGQATVAHLYRAMPKNATAQDSARVQEEINIYARRLSEGDEFETLVKMYSDDKGSRDKGGLLPKFNSNRMVPDFIKAVSKLDEPGDISAPLQTSYGWHIIKLIERDRPGGYEDEVQDLKRKMSKDQRGRKSRDMVIERIKRENGYKEYPENLRELLDAIDTTYLAMKWDAEKVAGMKKNVVKLGGESYSQHDFAVFMEEKQRRRGTTSLEVFFYKQFKEYTEDLSIALEDSKLEDKYPEFKMLMQEYHDGILLFNLTDEKVWKKAVEDTAGLERYYAANKDKYMWDQRIEADIVMVNDPSRLSDIRSLVAEAAERGQSLHEVGLDTLDGVFVEHGLYTRSDNSLVQNIEWEAGMTESMKLTDFNEFYNGNLHDENSSVFVLVRELREPEHKTLDEARGHVTSDYQNYLEDEWIRKLKEKYSLSINENVLQDIQQ